MVGRSQQQRVTHGIGILAEGSVTDIPELICGLNNSNDTASGHFLWPPCVADADIIFCSCGYFLPVFSSPNLSGRTLDVCHTSTHGVALVRI